MFLDHTHTHITYGMTPLERGSVSRRDLYLTTHNTHNRQTAIPPVGFESAIPASEWPQTHAAHRGANGIGQLLFCDPKNAIEVQRKGKLILYCCSDLSKSYLYWQYMNIAVLFTRVKPERK